MNPQLRILIRTEVRELFHQRRMYHFVPLALLGVFLMAWIYPVGSPFAPVIIIALLGLEPQFNNAFFRTPNELHALGLFPVPWRDVVMAKNLASIVLLACVLIFASMFLLYFSPEAVTPGHVRDAACYVTTVVFPIVCTGNRQSLRRPRKYSGLRLDDVVQVLWMSVTLAYVSVPYYIMARLDAAPVWCVLYGIGSFWYWYRYSLAAAASFMNQEYTDLCLTK